MRDLGVAAKLVSPDTDQAFATKGPGYKAPLSVSDTYRMRVAKAHSATDTTQLTVKVGDVVKILADSNPEWYTVKYDKSIGMVPKSILVSMDEVVVTETPADSGSVTPRRVSDHEIKGKMRASFKGQEPGELTVEMGEKIRLAQTNQPDDDPDWTYVALTGREGEGWVPTAYIEFGVTDDFVRARRRGTISLESTLDLSDSSPPPEESRRDRSRRGTQSSLILALRRKSPPSTNMSGSEGSLSTSSSNETPYTPPASSDTSYRRKWSLPEVKALAGFAKLSKSTRSNSGSLPSPTISLADRSKSMSVPSSPMAAKREMSTSSGSLPSLGRMRSLRRPGQAATSRLSHETDSVVEPDDEEMSLEEMLKREPTCALFLDSSPASKRTSDASINLTGTTASMASLNYSVDSTRSSMQEDDEMSLEDILGSAPPPDASLKPLPIRLPPPPPPPPAPKLTREEHRNLVVKELVKTEEQYIKDLGLCLGFLDQLRGKGFISNEEIDTIVSNIPTIRDQHIPFLAELQTKNGLDMESVGSIGRLFTERTEMFKPYSKYAVNYPRALDLCVKYMVHPQWAPVVQEYEAIIGNCFNVQSYIIKPVQRILKYPLLLNEIIKKCDGEDPLTQDVFKGLGAMKEVADTLNEIKRKKDNMQKTKELFDGVDGWEGPNRVQIGSLNYHGDVVVLDVKEKRKEQQDCYVFERAIVFCRRNPHKERGDDGSRLFKFVRLLQMHHFTIKRDSMNMGGLEFTLIVDKSDGKRPVPLVVICRSCEEKEKWIKTMEDVQTAERNRRQQQEQMEEKYEAIMSITTSTAARKTSGESSDKRMILARIAQKHTRCKPIELTVNKDEMVQVIDWKPEWCEVKLIARMGQGLVPTSILRIQ